jgi:hypothetical protein
MRSKMMSITAIETREAVLLWVLMTMQVDSSGNHLECNYTQNKLGSKKIKIKIHGSPMQYLLPKRII